MDSAFNSRLIHAPFTVHFKQCTLNVYVMYVFSITWMESLVSSEGHLISIINTVLHSSLRWDAPSILVSTSVCAKKLNTSHTGACTCRVHTRLHVHVCYMYMNTVCSCDLLFLYFLGPKIFIRNVSSLACDIHVHCSFIFSDNTWIFGAWVVSFSWWRLCVWVRLGGSGQLSTLSMPKYVCVCKHALCPRE